jgi:hypothetical protein
MTAQTTTTYSYRFAAAIGAITSTDPVFLRSAAAYWQRVALRRQGHRAVGVDEVRLLGVTRRAIFEERAQVREATHEHVVARASTADSASSKGAPDHELDAARGVPPTAVPIAASLRALRDRVMSATPQHFAVTGADEADLHRDRAQDAGSTPTIGTCIHGPSSSST